MYGFIKDLFIPIITCILGAYLNDRHTKRINKKKVKKQTNISVMNF